MDETRYPVDMQDFETLRQMGYAYVDKTPYIRRMRDTFYFLSRPRRFGKSLFLSTLDAYYSGKRELFDGLDIAKYTTTWTKHPVLKFDFSKANQDSPEEVDQVIKEQLATYAAQYDVPYDNSTLTTILFDRLVKAAFEKTGQKVVLLIDEYDAPILNVIDRPQEEIDRFRAVMNGFYSPIKGLTPYFRLVFITGITKFSQLSIFSKLNNLSNISMLEDFEAICGITEEELLANFTSGITALAEKHGLTFEGALDRLRFKYDGYHFLDSPTRIYNPFSIINSLAKQKFDNYWFGSATPTFLLKVLRGRTLSIEQLDGKKLLSDAFDVAIEHVTDVLPILYQSGYLTIKYFQSGVYTLGFPNDEVRVGMSNVIYDTILPESNNEKTALKGSLVDSLNNGDIESALRELQSFLASVPYDLVQNRENYYQTILFCIFKMIGVAVDTEVRTSQGRIDIVVHTERFIYVMELKFDKSSLSALRQIKSKNYAAPYATSPKQLILVGIAFSPDTNTLKDWRISRPKK